MCDGLGNGISVVLSPGQRHEAPVFHDLYNASLEASKSSDRSLPAKMAGDKAYRAKHIANRLENDGIEPVIPKKANERPNPEDKPLDKETYRRRNIVERLIGWLKQWRAVATRYEKLARNYRSILLIALIERSLRGGA